ncbi:MAG: cyanophycinase [Bacteroidetes bacterium]|nr:cyanophycinase [Bacteroidota bacterium]
MKKLSILLLLILCSRASAQNPIKIDSSETRHGPQKGALVIIGGGGSTNEIWDKIIELAGGPQKARFVVVTNAAGDSAQLYANQGRELRERIGEDRVVQMHLTTIQEANDEQNLEILRQATGVFFVGGRQWRIADAYLNTLAHQEFWNILDRGGVISGSSAGATIQGSFLWRGDTSGPDILVGDHTQGLGFLRNSVIDQHLLARNRQFDLEAFVNMAPDYIGIGLDEATAIVVIRDELEVIGRSVVAIYNTENKPFFFLKQGQKYDLKERKLIRPARNQEVR